MKYKIKYGILENNIDVTSKVLEKCINNNIISIPENDCIRVILFEIDPIPGVLKSIFIYDENDNLIGEYHHAENVKINIDTNEIFCRGINLSKIQMKYKLKYGISTNNIRVTNIALKKCLKNNILSIPSNDSERARIFEIDPVPGVIKSIFIYENDILIGEYENEENIEINIDTNEIFRGGIKRLSKIHANLILHNGNFGEEFPEQLMVAKYLKGNEKVLEIGANIGRNSLIIGSIVNNDNFVSLECDLNSFELLKNNRNINNLKFNIEPSALSKKKLIQRGWETIQSDTLLNGYTNVNIIDYEDLQKKYNIIFDTLVLDCEGAFYYILSDMPQILNNINLIIMENDYWDINHKIFVDTILKAYNFYLDYNQPGGWGPCHNIFYQVWKK